MREGGREGEGGRAREREREERGEKEREREEREKERRRAAGETSGRGHFDRRGDKKTKRKEGL